MDSISIDLGKLIVPQLNGGTKPNATTGQMPVPPPLSHFDVGGLARRLPENVPLCKPHNWTTYFKYTEREQYIDKDTFVAARAAVPEVSDEEFETLFAELFRDKKDLLSALGSFFERVEAGSASREEFRNMLYAFGSEGLKYFQVNDPQIIEAVEQNIGFDLSGYIEQEIGGDDIKAVQFRKMFVAAYEASVINPKSMLKYQGESIYYGENAENEVTDDNSQAASQSVPQYSGENIDATANEVSEAADTFFKAVPGNLNFGKLNSIIQSKNYHAPVDCCPILPAVPHQSQAAAPIVAGKRVIKEITE
jgi:hypothetical protein